MEFARLVSFDGIEQRNEAASAACRDLNFRSFGFAERPLKKLNGCQIRPVAATLSASMACACRLARLLRDRSSI
jgi:hypothetical protein